MNDPQTSELGQAIQQITEKAQLLVREEIELAKAEISEPAVMSAMAHGDGAHGA